MSVRIQELAVPKGNTIPPCDLCGEKSTTKCDSCKCTYYCSDYHKKIDYDSFHESVCSTIAFIREEHTLPFSEEDRRDADNLLLSKKKEVQELAEITTRWWLVLENGEMAYPAAMTALNMAKDLVKIDNIEIVYPTCLVSESYLLLGDMENAQEYMVLASWVSQKHEIIPPEIFAKLKRLVGLVCMENDKWEQAREAFAECLYATSIEYGTSNIRTAVIYGLLGLCLLKFDNQEGAMTSFHSMSDKWLERLLTEYQAIMFRCATESEMSSDTKIRDLEFQFLESKIVFKRVYEAVRKLGMNPVTDLINFKILSVQALQYIRAGHKNEAIVYKQEALAVGSRTKQDKAVPKSKHPILMKVLGDDYLMLWEKKNNRPRTAATKYLEMIKAIDV